MSESNELINLTADIVSAHVSNNTVATNELSTLISSIHDALTKLSQPVEAEAPKQEPAVSIRSSIKHDHIVCLEDGKKLKMLKRYLRTNYSMTPEEYRAKWGLPRDYPMVAPAYAETRRDLATKIGLGRKKLEEAVVAPAKSAAKKAGKTVAEGLKAARQHLGSDAAAKPAAKRGRPAKAKPAEAPASEVPAETLAEA